MDSELYINKNQKLRFWIFLSGLFIISLIIGLIGFERYYDYHNIPHNAFKTIYATLQLFVLEGGNLNGYLPLELDIARFAAPLVSFIAIALTLLQIFRDQWERFKISLMRDHVIIVGYGTIGRTILNDLIKNGKKVLLIDSEFDISEKEELQNLKCRVLTGNITEKSILKKARIKHADFVYLLTDNDTTQIKACLLIYQLIIDSNRKKNNPLNCLMHLHNQELVSTLKNHQLVKNISDAFVLKVFNINESSARYLFDTYPPDREGISLNSHKIVQIVIFGFGSAGEALALQTAQIGHYLNGEKPKILIIDQHAKIKIDDFLSRYPTFNNFCDINFISIASDNPQVFNKVLPYINGNHLFTTIVLCYENRTENLLLGLQLDNIDWQNDVRIFIQTNDEFPMSTFSDIVKSYGPPSVVCSHGAIYSEFIDKKAITFHNYYLDKRKKETDFGKKAADVGWMELSQEYKDSNRKAVDHIGVKLRSIGYRIVDVTNTKPEITLSDEEILMLSKLEHKRWRAERSLAGWTFSETRNNKKRESPDLVDWDKLSKETQDYDINAVKSIPSVLATIGLKIISQLD